MNNDQLEKSGDQLIPTGEKDSFLAIKAAPGNRQEKSNDD